MPGRSFRLAPEAAASLRSLPPGPRREVERVLREGLGAGDGVPLLGPLEGLRSLSAARGRVRIVFRGAEALSIALRRAPDADLASIARRLLRVLLRQ
jgi:hypothetical protein